MVVDFERGGIDPADFRNGRNWHKPERSGVACGFEAARHGDPASEVAGGFETGAIWEIGAKSRNGSKGELPAIFGPTRKLCAIISRV